MRYLRKTAAAYLQPLFKAAGKALVGVGIVAAVGTYVWDSRGAPLGSIGEIKRAMAMCGYHVSGTKQFRTFFLGQILIEHIETKYSSDSKLQVDIN